MNIALAPEVLIFDGGVHATWLLIDRLRRGIVPVVAMVDNTEANDVIDVLVEEPLLPELSVLNVHVVNTMGDTYHQYKTPKAHLDGIADLFFTGDYSVPFAKHTLTLPTMVTEEQRKLGVLKYTLCSVHHDNVYAHTLLNTEEDAMNLPSFSITETSCSNLNALLSDLERWVPRAAAIAEGIDSLRGLKSHFPKPVVAKKKVTGRMSGRRR